ncbi:MAG: hypothetical protein ACF8Q5_07305 [Phycisphaerales bacterium JB040]
MKRVTLWVAMLAVPVAFGQPASPADEAPPHHLAPLDGATVVRPGSALLRLDRLRPYTQTLQMHALDADGTERAGVSMRFTFTRQTDEQGNDFWRFRSDIGSGENAMFYVVEFDPETGEALRQHQKDPLGEVVATFDGHTLRGTKTAPATDDLPDPQPEPFELALPTRIFQFSAVPSLVATMDLAPGQRISLPSIDFHKLEVGWVTLDFHQQEALDAPGGEIRAWAYDMYQLGGTFSERHLRTDTPALAQFVVEGNGRRFTWKTVAFETPDSG